MEQNFLYEYDFNNNNITKKNDISYKIKVFNSTINKLILNIKNISKTLGKQIIGANHLINEIMLEKQYSKKIMLLFDRIGMLDDSRKLLEENIKSINLNINHFFIEIQKILIIDNSKINNINIKEYNNNIEYKTLYNNNYIGQGNHKINLDDNNFFNTINDFHHKNKSQSKIKSNYEKFINFNKNMKKNNSSFKQFSMNNSGFEKNITFNKISNMNNSKNKKSRNIRLNQNYQLSSNLENTFKTASAKNIKNINYNSPTNKRITNENYAIILAKNIIKFLNLIKEMKTKYNNKDSIYDLEFKKVKLFYDKLKIYIMNLSKKVIDIYSNNNKINNNNIIIKNKNDIKLKENIKQNNTNNNINNSNINNNINNNNLVKNKKVNLLIEDNINFTYINSNKNPKLKIIITKEISFDIIQKEINNFIKNIHEIHENELIIPNENKEKIDYNAIITELQEKIKTLNNELAKYNPEIDIENKNEESKADKEQIELLLNENQELKNQIEEYKESNGISLSNSKEDKEQNYKEIINENESKIKFLTEKIIFYESKLQKYEENNKKENIDIINLKLENSKLQKDNENTKKENNFLNEKIKEYNIKNNFEEILPDKYDIICEKNFEKLCWILLRKKGENEKEYESYLWIGKYMVKNLDKFNFLNEEESINRQIMYYISKLEEKEDVIFKLKQQLNNKNEKNETK